ncbi:hypothetical protein BDV12DRAFT_176902 [Aspergillus spectabilis]
MWVGTSLLQYHHSVCFRETMSICSLKPSKQIAQSCGPKLYRPDAGKTLADLEFYQRIMLAILLNDTPIREPRL